MPMLYTDADYAASNACCEKIGYMLKGKLCTIGSDTLRSVCKEASYFVPYGSPK